MKIIDFHSHILPGIDDGSRSREMSRVMLEAEAEQGVQVVCLTPHFYAESMYLESFLEKRQEAWEKIHPAMEKISLQGILAAECAFFPGIGSSEAPEQLLYEGSRTLLLEMPFRAWTLTDIDEVQKLTERRIDVVIAHLERFPAFQKDRSMIPALLDLPVYIQINAGELDRFRMRGKLVSGFKGGICHLLGSDAHSPHQRPVNLGPGREILRRKAGPAVLQAVDETGTKLLHLPEEISR